MNATLFKIWLFICLSLWAVFLIMVTVAGEFFDVNMGILAIALLLSLALLVVKRGSLALLLKRPQAKKGAGALVQTILILCVLAMANYIAVKHGKTFDFTRSKIHTLSDQSKTIAKDITKDTTMTLFSKREEWGRYLGLLKQYENLNPRIRVKAVDVEEKPALAKAKGVKNTATVIVGNGEREIKGSAASELEITNLLLKSMRDEELVIYRTIGHRELDPSQTDESGGSFLFGRLQGAGYEIRPYDSLATKEVPKDADAVLVIGPKQDFEKTEIQALSSYLEKGGNLFLLLGPDFKGVNYENLRSLLKDRGILHHNALVLDRLSAVQGANATIPIVNDYNSDHSITKSFEGRTLFPLSAALEKISSQKNKVSVLAKSSAFPASWAESQLKEINSGKVFYNKGLDLKGPVALWAVSENTDDHGRVAVGTSVEMVGNAYQKQSSNFNLFMNTLAWLLDDEGIISLNRPGLSDNMIILSASQISLIFYFSILFLPFALFGTAIYVYRRKSKK